MNEGIIDPYQIASAFHNGSVHYAPYFKEMVINMQSEEMPCKYPGTCDLKCVLCHSLIVNRDDIELKRWPGFKVHKACSSPCLYPGCPERLPTLPAYLSLQRSTLMCETHKDSNAFQKLSISVSTDIQERRESMLKKPPLYPTPAPTRLPQPLHVQRNVQPEPSVKKTYSFKKPLGKAKADKFNERGRSVSILNFFKTPRAEAAIARKAAQDQEKALKASKQDDAPRRFIKNKETGEVFGYWKGNHAYHIETDEILFSSNDASKGMERLGKLDFSPPVSLHLETAGRPTQAPEEPVSTHSLAGSSSPPDEKEQEEGRSSP